jgi:hypothetical protein
MSKIQLADVYLRERHMPLGVRQTLWTTDSTHTILITKTSYAQGYYFLEMSIETPQYAIVIRESLGDADENISYVKVWAESETALCTNAAPVIQSLRRVLYPDTVIFSSICPCKLNCVRFECAPESVQKMFV